MIGLGLLFVPLDDAAYLYLPKNQVNDTTGLFNMLRNEGGSLGIAIASTTVDRRSRFHRSRLVEHVVPTNLAVESSLRQLSDLRIVRGGTTMAMGPDDSWALNGRRSSSRPVSWPTSTSFGSTGSWTWSHSRSSS